MFHSAFDVGETLSSVRGKSRDDNTFILRDTPLPARSMDRQRGYAETFVAAGVRTLARRVRNPRGQSRRQQRDPSTLLRRVHYGKDDNVARFTVTRLPRSSCPVW